MDKELIDKAWSALPKEFKEEVKKDYAVITENAEWDEAYNCALEETFGIHNLTSDAEGEEMLTVSRKAVLVSYDYHKSRGHHLTADTLYDLFGSKCLPDACNVASNVASTEPKPAEPRFKRGDKAKIVGGNPEFIGEVAKMKPIKSKVSVHLATKEEDEEFRTLLYENGFMWSSGNALTSLSNWDSDHKDYQIHFVYPDKTVTFLGKRTEETLTFTEFKKRYFGEDVNLSQETANCDKQFDTILKDGFRNERRLNIATQFCTAMFSNPALTNLMTAPGNIAELAVKSTDIFLAEYEKGVTE